jgi:transposase
MDDRGQRLLGEPPGLQEAREIRALAQFRDAQLDRPRPRFPNPLAVAVALRQAIRALLAQRGTRLAADVEFHQPRGGKPEHLTHQVGVGRLLQQPLKGHHLVGHQWSLQFRLTMTTRPYRRTAGGHPQLHHVRGHDLRLGRGLSPSSCQTCSAHGSDRMPPGLRWVIERTFAWLGRNRRLAKDVETLIETNAAMAAAAIVQLLVRRLARY